jgi:uncharacterized lipoprotein YmbA
MSARRQRASWLATAAAGVVLAACSFSSPTPEMRYYVLAVPPGTAPALRVPVRVEGFSIDDPYATRQLAYRTSPYRLAYYNYHRWAGSPQSVVAGAAREYLGRATPAGDGPAFELSGHIRRLEEVDGADGWQGTIAMDVTVRRQGTVVLDRAVAETEPAAERNPEAVVAALSRALGRVLDRLAADLATLGDVP